MLATDFTPEWTETSWPAISQSTGIERNTFKHYLGKARGCEVGSVNHGCMNKDGAFVLNCGGGRWEAKYLINPNRKLLFIDNIEAPGNGPYIFSRIIEFGVSSQLFNRVELWAGKSGPHIWPRYGFLTSQSEWDSLRTAEHRLAINLGEIKKSPSDPQVVANVGRALDFILHDRDPRKLWELASQQEYIELRDGRSGKAGTLILRGEPARYSAHFSLDNCEQLQIFETYKRLKLKF